MILEAIDICCRATPPDFDLMLAGLKEAEAVPRMIPELWQGLGVVEAAAHEPGHGLESLRKARRARQERIDYWDRGDFGNCFCFNYNYDGWELREKHEPRRSGLKRDPETGERRMVFHLVEWWCTETAPFLERDTEKLMVIRENIAMALLAEGKADEALSMMQAIYEEATERKKGQPLTGLYITVPFHVGAALKELGRLEEAKEMIDETIGAASESAGDHPKELGL